MSEKIAREKKIYFFVQRFSTWIIFQATRLEVFLKSPFKFLRNSRKYIFFLIGKKGR
jgi:hypothetical protein